MTREQFIKHLENTFEKAMAIVKAKNDDYAKGSDPFSNFKFAQIIGLGVKEAILVRVSDKFARVANLLEKGKISVKDESIEDTLIDMINYLAILLAYLDNEKKN